MKDYSKGRSEEELEPFFPNEILRHALLTFFFLSAVMVAVIFLPESFQKSTDEFAAFQSKPPWYLQPFYQLSSMVKNKVTYVIILTIFAITFISIPFLDRKSERRLWKKPIFLSIIVINLSMIFILGFFSFFQ
jgi:quinol-cytochrome oxidoreductase complex cytochrome b subunit